MSAYTLQTKRFPAKDPEEIVFVQFDFTNDLGTDTPLALSTATVTAAVYEVTPGDGTDASPSSILIGSPTIVGNVVQQKVSGGVADVNYRLQALIQTTGGQTLGLAGILPVAEI